MIPINAIAEWRQNAPWILQSQVEQDLVLSRALIQLYKNAIVQKNLAFRGGTAINKLFVIDPARYSEDLDFVQIHNQPIGEVISGIRESLDSWLGPARWKQTDRSVKLIYRFLSEDQPPVPLRLKVEINTVESFSIFGYEYRDYRIDNQWFAGNAQITTYTMEELMGTKLRALYQRAKSRDLYDLWLGITHLNMDCAKVIQAFKYYNQFNKTSISSAAFAKNLILKMQTQDFLRDHTIVLAKHAHWVPEDGYELVMEELIANLESETMVVYS